MKTVGLLLLVALLVVVLDMVLASAIPAPHVLSAQNCPVPDQFGHMPPAAPTWCQP